MKYESEIREIIRMAQEKGVEQQFCVIDKSLFCGGIKLSLPDGKVSVICNEMVENGLAKILRNSNSAIYYELTVRAEDF